MLTLTQEQLDALLTILPNGDLRLDRQTLAQLVAQALDTDATPRVALTGMDYAEDDNHAPVPDTRAATGVWWVADEHDEAMVGTWTVDGRAMTVAEEGITLSPVAEDESLVARATRAAEAVPADKPIKVFVTRDGRITRPHDLLDDEDLAAFEAGKLGVVMVMPLGGDKAIMRRHNC